MVQWILRTCHTSPPVVTLVFVLGTDLSQHLCSVNSICQVSGKHGAISLNLRRVLPQVGVLAKSCPVQFALL